MPLLVRVHDQLLAHTVDVFYSAEDVDGVRRDWNRERRVPIRDLVTGDRRTRPCDVSLAAWRVMLAAAARRLLDASAGGKNPPQEVADAFHASALSFAIALESLTEALPDLIDVHLVRGDAARIRWHAGIVVGFRLAPTESTGSESGDA